MGASRLHELARKIAFAAIVSVKLTTLERLNF
jgi:hypothetical protein